MPASNIQGDLHIDRYLTGFAVDFEQSSQNFVAGAMATPVPVNKQSDLYVIYDRGQMWRDEAEVRPLGGRPVQMGTKHTNGTYNAQEWALEAMVDDRQRVNADEPINIEESRTKQLMQKHMIRADRVWAQKFFGTGNWSAEFTGVDSGPNASQFLQFDQSGSDPIDIINGYADEILSRLGMRPNRLTLGVETFRAIRNNASVIDRIKHTERATVTQDILASLLELDQVRVARSIYNSAAEGAADNFSFIADSKGALLAYIDDTPSTDAMTAISLFRWSGLIGGGETPLGIAIERGRDERARSDYFQARQAWDMAKVTDDAGLYMASCVG